MNKPSQNTKEQYEAPEILNVEPFTVSVVQGDSQGDDGGSGGGGE